MTDADHSLRRSQKHHGCTYLPSLLFVREVFVVFWGNGVVLGLQLWQFVVGGVADPNAKILNVHGASGWLERNQWSWIEFCALGSWSVLPRGHEDRTFRVFLPVPVPLSGVVAVSEPR